MVTTMQGNRGHHGRGWRNVSLAEGPQAVLWLQTLRGRPRGPGPALHRREVWCPGTSDSFPQLHFSMPFCASVKAKQTHNLINSALSFIVCTVGPSSGSCPQLPGVLAELLSPASRCCPAARLRAGADAPSKALQAWGLPQRLPAETAGCSRGSRPALSSSLAAGGRVGRGGQWSGTDPAGGAPLSRGHAHEWSVCCRLCKKAKNGEMKLYI